MDFRPANFAPAFAGSVAYNQGSMRQAWVASRAGDPIRTQIYYARQGRITEEMEYVARRERLAPELIRDEVAR